MSSNTYTVDTPTTGILGYTLVVFSVRPFVCLQNSSLHQSNVLRSAGIHNLLQGFCTTEGYSVKQITIKYNDNPASHFH